MIRNLFKRIVAIMLVATVCEMVRRVNRVLSVVRRFEGVARGRA